VLSSVKEEEEFEITDVALDDFVMFRYEMNSIFKKAYFVGESDTDAFYGGL
jgi:hypothetical protein